MQDEKKSSKSDDNPSWGRTYIIILIVLILVIAVLSPMLDSGSDENNRERATEESSETTSSIVAGESKDSLEEKDQVPGTEDSIGLDCETQGLVEICVDFPCELGRGTWECGAEENAASSINWILVCDNAQWITLVNIIIPIKGVYILSRGDQKPDLIVEGPTMLEFYPDSTTVWGVERIHSGESIDTTIPVLEGSVRDCTPPTTTTTTTEGAILSFGSAPSGNPRNTSLLSSK